MGGAFSQPPSSRATAARRARDGATGLKENRDHFMRASSPGTTVTLVFIIYRIGSGGRMRDGRDSL
jgi:hypothetical protein